MPKTFSYNKTEKLKSRKQMEQLFARGKSFLVFPVKVFYMEMAGETDGPIKVGVGASSKVFKKAVHRNRVKRLLREAYRLNKIPLHEFVEANNKKVAVFMLYIDKTLPQMPQLETKMPLVIDKLINSIA
jgi:ribonuclease P protein component